MDWDQTLHTAVFPQRHVRLLYRMKFYYRGLHNYVNFGYSFFKNQYFYYKLPYFLHQNFIGFFFFNRYNNKMLNNISYFLPPFFFLNFFFFISFFFFKDIFFLFFLMPNSFHSLRYD